MTKWYCILFSIFVVSGHSFAQNRLTLISDLDDTIKQTNISNKLHAVCNGLLSYKSFGGMAALYRELTETLFIVSGKPESLREKANAFVAQNGFVAEKIYMRTSLFADLKVSKIKALKGVIEKADGDVVLIGDDTQMDPEIMSELREQYPSKIVAVYIRAVNYRTLPKGGRRFFHPYEIAVEQWHEGRLSTSALLRLASLMITEMRNDSESYFPNYAYCPNSKGFLALKQAHASTDLAVKAATVTIEDLILQICEAKFEAGFL